MKLRDFLIRSDLKFFDDRDGSVKDIMTCAPPVTVAPDTAVEALATSLVKSEVDKLTIFADDHASVGLSAT